MATRLQRPNVLMTTPRLTYCQFIQMCWWQNGHCRMVARYHLCLWAESQRYSQRRNRPDRQQELCHSLPDQWQESGKGWREVQSWDPHIRRRADHMIWRYLCSHFFFCRNIDVAKIAIIFCAKKEFHRTRLVKTIFYWKTLFFQKKSCIFAASIINAYELSAYIWIYRSHQVGRG